VQTTQRGLRLSQQRAGAERAGEKHLNEGRRTCGRGSLDRGVGPIALLRAARAGRSSLSGIRGGIRRQGSRLRDHRFFYGRKKRCFKESLARQRWSTPMWSKKSSFQISYRQSGMFLMGECTASKWLRSRIPKNLLQEGGGEEEEKNYRRVKSFWAGKPHVTGKICGGNS